MADFKKAWNNARFCLAPHSGRLANEDKQYAAILAGLFYIGDVIAEAVRDSKSNIKEANAD